MRTVVGTTVSPVTVYRTSLSNLSARYTYQVPVSAPATAPAPPKPVYASKGQYWGATIACTKGLTCIGRGAAAKCYGVMNHGGVCDGAYMICASGTACRAPAYGNGPKKCVAPHVKGNGCDSGYHFCGSGLTCAQYGGTIRCIRVMQENEDCSQTFMLCSKGLVCTRDGSYRQCRKPRANKGEYCSADLKCADGLTCVGSGAEAKCIGVMGSGGVCSGLYMACESGLSCRAPAYGTGPKKCLAPRVSKATDATADTTSVEPDSIAASGERPLVVSVWWVLMAIAHHHSLCARTRPCAAGPLGIANAFFRSRFTHRRLLARCTIEGRRLT